MGILIIVTSVLVVYLMNYLDKRLMGIEPKEAARESVFDTLLIIALTTSALSLALYTITL